jgi:hypothetical protein
MNNQIITAPTPANYPCNDPDFSKPLPGQVTHWPDNPAAFVRPRTCQPPVGFLADPFMRKQVGPCSATNPRPWVGPKIVAGQPPTDIF